MPYRLFLDDIRFPPDDGNEWVIARTFDEAVAIINEQGFPAFVSFDHDLGENVKDGMDLAHFLVDLDLDTGAMPDGFDFYVHSANPVGKSNIEGALRRYLAFRAEERGQQ